MGHRRPVHVGGLPVSFDLTRPAPDDQTHFWINERWLRLTVLTDQRAVIDSRLTGSLCPRCFRVWDEASGCERVLCWPRAEGRRLRLAARQTPAGVRRRSSAWPWSGTSAFREHHLR